MSTRGIVRFWNDEDGWGVIDSAETPGGCWSHYSVLSVTGFSTLSSGQAVEFDWEMGEQDGYGYRALFVQAGKNT